MPRTISLHYNNAAKIQFILQMQKKITFFEKNKLLFSCNKSCAKMPFVNDSVVSFSFKNKSQITEWGKNFDFSLFMPFAAVFSAEFYIKDSNIFILMVHGCSGIPCISFYVFKEKDDIWELQTTSRAILKEQFRIRVDNEKDKIVFETVSRKIGELSF